MNGLINFPHQLTMAILYSLAIGCASYIILCIALWLFRSAPSLFKYHFSNVCLLLVFVAFLWPFHNLLQEKQTVAVQEQFTQPAAKTNNPGTKSSSSMANAGTPIAIPALIEQPSPLPNVSQAAPASWPDLVFSKTEEWSNIIFVIYLVGLLFFSCRLIISYIYSLSLKSNGLSPADERWTNCLNYAKEKLNIKRTLPIFFSAKAVTPCIIGYSKAVILIPLALSAQLSTEQAEAILLHELAHLKHYDYYINIVTQAINSILFFNPFSWLIIHKCKQYREQACDEITATQQRTIALAESLAMIAENGNKSNALVLTLKENKYKLLHRIQNLLGRDNKPKLSYNSLLAMLIPLIITTCMLLYSTNIFSQKKDDLKTQLAKISEQMYEDGNVRYMIVDAMIDSILPSSGKITNNSIYIDVNIKDSSIIISGKTSGAKFTDQLKNKYLVKMDLFLSRFGEPRRKIMILYYDEAGLTLNEVLDPDSRFRKNSAASRVSAGISTLARKKMIRHLLEDKLIKPTDHVVYITYNEKELAINNIAFTPALKEKYQNLFKENGFTDLLWGRGTWNMPFTAEKYIAQATDKYEVKPAQIDNKLREQLKTISSEMYKNGNENYVLVDAIADTLISVYQKADMLIVGNIEYANNEDAYWAASISIITAGDGYVGVNGKKLDGPLKGRYVTKMKQFLASLKETNDTINIRPFYFNNLSIDEIKDPVSDFRKVNMFSRREAGIFTLMQKKLVQNLLQDRLVLPADSSYILQYHSVGYKPYIKINNVPLSGAIKEKYVHFLETEWGSVFYGNHEQCGGGSIPTQLKTSLAEYVSDMPPLAPGTPLSFDDPIKNIRDQLVAISDTMLNEGNEKYVIVDAIIDSLLPLHALAGADAGKQGPAIYSLVDKNIEVSFISNNIFVNGTSLTDGIRNAYAGKMIVAFMPKLKEKNDVFLISYKDPKGITLADIFDPNSAFRKLNIADRTKAGFYTEARKKMVQHFLDDKLIASRSSPINITYNSDDIIINNKTLKGVQKTKYHDLLEHEYGADLEHDSYSGVWNVRNPDEEEPHIVGIPFVPHSRQDFEKAMRKFQNFYNKDQADSICNMFSDTWGGQRSSLWTDIDMMDSKKKYGEMISFKYLGIDSVSDANKVCLFINTFTKSRHVTGFTLDKNNKFETFRFKTSSSYIDSLFESEGTTGLRRDSGTVNTGSLQNEQNNYAGPLNDEPDNTGFNKVFERKLVQNFINDKLIRPSDDHFSLEYYSIGPKAFVKINHIPLSGAIKAKYVSMLETEGGVILRDNHWQRSGEIQTYLHCTAGEFVSYLPYMQATPTPGFDDPIKNIRDQLVAVSDRMFQEGNEKYVIVDAIIDSLLPFTIPAGIDLSRSLSKQEALLCKLKNKNIDILFMALSPSVNGVQLTQGIWNSYAVKMNFFLKMLYEPRGVINVTYKSNKGLNLAEILDPNSAFRKLSMVDRNRAGIYTVARKKMVQHFLYDQLISPSDTKLNITYGNDDIIINEKHLSGALKTKYKKLLEHEYGVDLGYDTYSGTWNMDGSVQEYIRDVQPLKDGPKKTGFINTPKAGPDYKHAVEWAPIAMSNVFWKKRVWKDIDTREKDNKAFSLSKNIPVQKNFYSILSDGFLKGLYKCYDPIDDKFSKELSLQEFQNILHRTDPKQILKFRIKEDSLFLTKEGTYTTRILGIAPVKETIGADGKPIDEPICWFFYAGNDMRNYLAQFLVYNSSVDASQTWYDLLENEQFYSKIIKTSGAPLQPH